MLPYSLDEGYLYGKAYADLTGYIGRIQLHDGSLYFQIDVPDEYCDNWEDIDILWEAWETLWNTGQTSAMNLYIVPVNYLESSVSFVVGQTASGDAVSVSFSAGHLPYVAKKADNLFFAPEYTSGEGMFLVFFQPVFTSSHYFGYVESMSGTREQMRTIPIKDKGVLKQRKRIISVDNQLTIQQSYQSASAGLISLSEQPCILQYDIKSGVSVDERHLYYGCHIKQGEENFDIDYEYHFVEE